MITKRIAIFTSTTTLVVALLAAPLASSAGAATITKRVIKVEASISSQQKITHTVSPNGRRVYGFNLLVGRDESGSNPIDVEMLGNVNYLKGNGAFFGFITFTAKDGSTLGVQMNGTAKLLPNGTDTRFSAPLKVIGGTGKWLKAAGKGTFTGSRTAALGTEVKSKFVIRLKAR
ncbi:MAG: hypothetical protein JHC66_02225 [Acidimicrobiia bacterium]|nr:hypothetical protein [Acidimicrobiia bacterium]